MLLGPMNRTQMAVDPYRLNMSACGSVAACCGFCAKGFEDSSRCVFKGLFMADAVRYWEFLDFSVAHLGACVLWRVADILTRKWWWDYTFSVFQMNTTKVRWLSMLFLRLALMSSNSEVLAISLASPQINIIN